jgi:hypothetical protein
MNNYSIGIIVVLIGMYGIRLVLSIMNYRHRTAAIPEKCVTHLYKSPLSKMAQL